ncbi:hypothetical protein GGS21DRAFT_506839 [Xylaria nigripes]|nr:hypothetical protein GGS21DRAFT_506839 [Xylaria nigripes]
MYKVYPTCKVQCKRTTHGQRSTLHYTRTFAGGTGTWWQTHTALLSWLGPDMEHCRVSNHRRGFPTLSSLVISYKVQLKVPPVTPLLPTTYYNYYYYYYNCCYCCYCYCYYYLPTPATTPTITTTTTTTPPPTTYYIVVPHLDLSTPAHPLRAREYPIIDSWPFFFLTSCSEGKLVVILDENLPSPLYTTIISFIPTTLDNYLLLQQDAS